MVVTKTEIQARLDLKNKFPLYAAKILKIRTKGVRINPWDPEDLRCEEAISPLILNFSQRFIHAKIEAQKKATGQVRVLILKCRQNGASTYSGGRFFHQSTHRFGAKAFILTHELRATDNLFNMVKRFKEHAPKNILPKVGTSNKKELIFSQLDSGYGVGTAGNQEVGRSDCIQLFHGSEVAFWKNGESIFAGLGQAIPGAPGTEVILESTANGMNNFFYQQWEMAVSGKSDYIPIFIPWFWVPEYYKYPDHDFQLTPEEAEYKVLYNLDDGQLLWRRGKIADLNDNEALFKQEYPANATEAFQFSKTDSFNPVELIVKARKQKPHSSFGAVIAGYDPKKDGSDSNAFVYRQNHNIWGLEYHNFMTVGEQVNFLKNKLDQTIPYIDMLFIDYGGSGWSIHGLLVEDGYGDRVRVVRFGGDALNKAAYVNRRAEMWDRARTALKDPTAPLSLPDSNRLQQEATCLGCTHTSNGRLLLQSKSEIKISPDGWDAVVLTFAENIIRKHVNRFPNNKPQIAVN